MLSVESYTYTHIHYTVRCCCHCSWYCCCLQRFLSTILFCIVHPISLPVLYYSYIALYKYVCPFPYKIHILIHASPEHEFSLEWILISSLKIWKITSNGNDLYGIVPYKSNNLNNLIYCEKMVEKYTKLTPVSREQWVISLSCSKLMDKKENTQSHTWCKLYRILAYPYTNGGNIRFTSK